MTWLEESRTFSINKREGKYPGMLQNRNFNILITGESKIHAIQYDGDFIEIKI